MTIDGFSVVETVDGVRVPDSTVDVTRRDKRCGFVERHRVAGFTRLATKFQYFFSRVVLDSYFVLETTLVTTSHMYFDCTSWYEDEGNDFTAKGSERVVVMVFVRGPH